MNKKLKLITTSLLIVGALTACNPAKNTAIESQKRQTAYDYGYERTSYYGFNNYPNAYGYVPRPRSVTDRYTDMDINRVTYRNPKTDDYGNVKYSKINQEIHRNKNAVGYNYYADRNFHGHITNPYPTRNVTMNGYYTNADGATAEKITNRVKRIGDVDRVSTVVYGNDILVAVKARNTANAKTVEDKVLKAAMPYAKGRSLHVTVNESMYNRVRDISSHLRNGTMTNEMNKDLNGMFQSVRTDHNRMLR